MPDREDYSQREQTAGGELGGVGDGGEAAASSHVIEAKHDQLPVL